MKTTISMPKFSMIICTYNRDKYIYECLQCLAANNFPAELYEIVLVDNNSSDNTANECPILICILDIFWKLIKDYRMPAIAE